MTTSISSFAEAPQMYEIESYISEKRRVELIALMNQWLTSAADLQAQVKQAHCNVQGSGFIRLQGLFDKVDEAVVSYREMVSERIIQLGGVVEGAVPVATSPSLLEEYSLAIGDGLARVEAVSMALAAFAREARNMIDEADQLCDADTADLFTEISRGMDNWLWFVEAHLKSPE